MYRVSELDFSISKIADSGQVFRFYRCGENEYALTAGARHLRIREQEISKGGNRQRVYDFDCSPKDFEQFWKGYFDLDTDYAPFVQAIPREDVFLRSAAEYAKGIRILRQDKWEMLISFIISQRKTIPAIQSCIENLARRFGKAIGDRQYAFPTAEALAAADLADLRACALGYRAAYVKESALQVAKGGYDLEAMAALPDDQLRKKLMEFKGVGEKVANCVMLFAYHRIAAFPVDVWIQRMIDRHYGGRFPLERYEGYAGVLQQYIFFYGRETDKKK